MEKTKQIRVLKDALDTAFEILKSIKYSSQREACFGRIKFELAPDTPGVRALCPTRWTVRADALRGNYEVLTKAWVETPDIVKDSEMKACINDVASQMKEFYFLFGVSLAELILHHSDNLSRTIDILDNLNGIGNG